MHQHLSARPVGAADAILAGLDESRLQRHPDEGRSRFLLVLALPVDQGRHPDQAATSAATGALAAELEAAADGDDLGDVWVEPENGRVIALLAADAPRTVSRRVSSLCARLSSTPLRLADGTEGLVDVGAGWMPLTAGSSRQDVESRLRLATAAAHRSLGNRDHVGVEVQEEAGRTASLPGGPRLALQVALSLLPSLVLPFLAMVGAYELGVDISTAVYVMVVASLGLTAVLIWCESLHALSPPEVPETPESAPPSATALIAAYLPNEAETIVETVRHMLGQDYPDLQVILAYNTPETLPVESELAELARMHPRLELLRVEGSTSKAQNVNAALSRARGEFIGIFDADHHPMAGAFSRAWRWIADGADVVQGHCVVRNGDESRISRTVAVEFEQIYAVSHPGRASMHGFGLFGGSNGYWRTSVLRQMRLRVDRLTEDIDVSIRSVLAGHRIVNDAGLISRELAPTSVRALWRQRVRWAQGWFQVSLATVPAVLRQPGLSLRQRAGMAVLLGWREVYPWISPMILAVLAFVWWRDGGLSWSSPLFWLTTLYTLTSGPLQVLFAWRLSAPEIRERRSWFLAYLLVAGLFYTEAKNVVARVAQLKQLSGEHEWVVTPRTRAVRTIVPSSAETDLEVVA